jgi:hypothetical protein
MPARTRKRSTDSRPTNPLEHDFFTLVPDARPVALEILQTLGLKDEGAGDLFGHFTKFADDDDPIEIADDEFPRVVNIAMHAYAVGIAVGLLLRPELFAKGGAR